MPDCPCPQPGAAAEDIAARFENDLRIEALAVTINETDEAQTCGRPSPISPLKRRPGSGGGSCNCRQALSRPCPIRIGCRHRSKAWRRSLPGGSFCMARMTGSAAPGGISLEIDAGTAFGTGHHGTTAGCLLALDAMLKRRQARNAFSISAAAPASSPSPRHGPRAKPLPPTSIPKRCGSRGECRRTMASAPLLDDDTAPGLKHTGIASGAPYDLIFANILARPLVAWPRACTDPGSRRRSDPLRPHPRPDAAGFWRPIAIAAWFRFRPCARQLGNAGLDTPAKQKRPDRFRAGRLVSRLYGSRLEEFEGLVAPNHLLDLRRLRPISASRRSSSWAAGARRGCGRSRP